VRLAAAERQRQVMQLRIRGLTFEAIGKQIGCTRVIAFRVYRKALKAIPRADVEEYRKLETERIADLRQRLWSELAGRADPADPTKTIRPDTETTMGIIRTAVRLARHEAMLFGLDAPIKADISGTFGAAQPITDEEAAMRWGRLTTDEQETWMRLQAKMDGRWTEPLAIETTAVAVEPPKNVNGSGEAKA